MNSKTALINLIMDKAQTIGEGYLTIICKEAEWMFIFGGGILMPNSSQVINIDRKNYSRFEGALCECLSVMDKQVDYKTYLQSDRWMAFAENAKRRFGYRCQLCNKHKDETVLHAHHRTYEHLGNEHIEDVTVLCETCHAKHHDVIGRE